MNISEKERTFLIEISETERKELMATFKNMQITNNKTASDFYSLLKEMNII